MKLFPENFFNGPNYLTWKTDCGFHCTIILTDMGHYCGYVTFPKEIAPDKNELNVHGGITWDNEHLPDKRIIPDAWTMGFDCAHWGDLSGYNFDRADELKAEWRSFDYVLRQVISLHDQIRDWKNK